MRRITKPLSLLLALVMAIGLLPVTALAAESETASVTVGTTGGWGAFAETSALSFPFGQSGNKVKVWTDSVGINISAIAVNGDTRPLTDAAVEVQGADFNGSAVENLHNAGSYAVIDLDALGFGDLSGTQSVTLTYATENDGFELHAVSSFDEVQLLAETSTPTAEPTTESATEVGEAPAEADQEVAEYAATSYGKVTVTGIAATGDWDATNSAHQNWFEIKDVRLDPNGNIKIYGENAGINIAAVEINGQKVTVTEMKNNSKVTVVGVPNDYGGLELKGGSEYQIAWLDQNGVSATIQLSAFSGLTAGAYSIKFYYAIQTDPATLIVESSAGGDETTATYDSIYHGNPGGTIAPPTGNANPTSERQSVSGTHQTNPSKAVWFFDSHGERKSFNTVNDTYEDELQDKDNNQTGDHKNNLVLYASTDGTLRNTGTDGELRVNWESQNRIQTVGIGSNDLMKDGYTDGSYTVVGWGGKFQDGEDKPKEAIRFVIKDADANDKTLVDALSHLTIYLVDEKGQIKDKVWVKGNNPNGAGSNADEDSLHYVKTLDGGYHVYEAALKGDHTIQGIKLAFDRYTQTDIYSENSNTHHSGTLVIADVQMQVNSNWVDFSPFHYSDNDNEYERSYKSPVISNSRPFLRSAHFETKLKPGEKAGYNLAIPQAGFEWHLWTMSTSDANIVNNSYSSADALQIKYSNTEQHTTYTHLVGGTELNGEWLAITLGGEVDWNTKFQLVNSEAPSATDPADVVKTLSLHDFTTDRNSGGAVTAATFSDNRYHTIYYHMQGETFCSVYVDFSGVTDTPGDASRYMYITEIYLLEPAAKIEKAVNKTEASTGDELVYTLTVTNNDEQPINRFTVTDVLPEDVSYVGSNPSDGVTVEADGRTITWTYSGTLASGQSTKLDITVKVNAGFNGTLYNSATITSLNGNGKSIGSNRVATVVTATTPDEFVFYAEVGQKTTLPIALGNTATTTTKTDTVTGNAVGVNLTSGGSGQNDYRTVSADVTLNNPGSIKITTDHDGGLSIRSISLNGTPILTVDNKQMTLGDNVTVKGEGHLQLDEWSWYEISNLKNGYIEISNLEAGTYTVAFLYRSWDSPFLQLTPITTGTVTVIGDPEPDTVASVSVSGMGAEIDAGGILNKNFGDLFYTNKSGNAGMDTFTLTYNPGGDTTKTQTATVKVYNYQVKDHIYVLDYGLSVNLTGGTSGLLYDAKLNIEGDDTGYAFAGLRTEEKGKRNTNGVADKDDYATPYGDQLVVGQNGEAQWKGSPNDQSLGVTFTPTTFMSSVDTFYYGVQVSKNNTVPSNATNATPVMEGQIKIMPANVVYYEDNFSQSDTDEANGVNGIIYSGGKAVGDKEDSFQWQTNDQNSPYGYDKEAYENAIGDFSNGNAHQLSINDTASFTFKGTGFDIIGRTNNATGILMAMIYTEDQNEEGKMVFDKFIVVDTYYENGDLFQIPVISVLNLAYGKHRVDLYSLKGYADEYAGNTSTIYIDGVRIYNPLGVNGNEDYNEGEQGAEFKELKSMIFGDNFEYDRENPENSRLGDEDKSMATLIKFVKYGNEDLLLNGATLVEILKNRNDSTETVSQEPGRTFDLLTYAFSGPNKELYLENDYGFGFAPERTNAEEPATLQIGVKLVSRPANTSLYPTIEYLDGDGNWQTLREVRSATEKYYSLDDLLADRVNKLYGEGEWVVLRVNDNRSGAVVSVTKVKYKNYTFEPLGTDEKNNATPEFAHDDIKVRTGYDTRNNTFKTGSISMSVQTKIDIKEVRVYSDEEGTTQMTLLAMAYRDSSQDDATVRTWTIKFKGTEKQKNYWLQIVDQYGNVSELVAAK